MVVHSIVQTLEDKVEVKIAESSSLIHYYEGVLREEGDVIYVTSTQLKADFRLKVATLQGYVVHVATLVDEVKRGINLSKNGAVIRIAVVISPHMLNEVSHFFDVFVPTLHVATVRLSCRFAKVAHGFVIKAAERHDGYGTLTQG